MTAPLPQRQPGGDYLGGAPMLPRSETPQEYFSTSQGPVARPGTAQSNMSYDPYRADVEAQRGPPNRGQNARSIRDGNGGYGGPGQRPGRGDGYQYQ